MRAKQSGKSNLYLLKITPPEEGCLDVDEDACMKVALPELPIIHAAP